MSVGTKGKSDGPETDSGMSSGDAAKGVKTVAEHDGHDPEVAAITWDKPGKRSRAKTIGVRALQALSAVLVVAALVILFWPASEDGPEAVATTTSTTVPDELDSTPFALKSGYENHSATVLPAEIKVHAKASSTSEVTNTFPSVTEHGQDQTFLIADGIRVGNQDWYEVLLPVRPNGTTGWVNGNDVRIDPISYKLDIYLSEHMLRVSEGGKVIREIPVGVGTVDTPTPGGLFYLMELLKPPNPDTAYGTYTYVLNGYSDVHKEFNGGPGLLGIHGTNRPDLIGTDVSNGCIRMTNENVEWLVPLLPFATPVQIHA